MRRFDRTKYIHKLEYVNLVAREAADLFAALGDRVRLRLACCLLAVPRGVCVSELVDALDVSQPNVSRHLKVLKAALLVYEHRDGRYLHSLPAQRASALR